MHIGVVQILQHFDYHREWQGKICYLAFVKSHSWWVEEFLFPFFPIGETPRVMSAVHWCVWKYCLLPNIWNWFITYLKYPTTFPSARITGKEACLLCNINAWRIFKEMNIPCHKHWCWGRSWVIMKMHSFLLASLDFSDSFSMVLRGGKAMKCLEKMLC